MNQPLLAKILKLKGVVLSEPEPIIIIDFDCNELLVQRKDNTLSVIPMTLDPDNETVIESALRFNVRSPLSIPGGRRPD